MHIEKHTGPAAPAKLARTNVTLPEDLLREVDRLAGPRGRSGYVAEAVALRVKRDRLARALRETAGAVPPSERATPSEIAARVEALRSEETD
ncbi:MAG: hypothetical protein A2X23_10920 [Chloroflexi bacterium GWC2_73_18]|nr:MAG: hypothetical protein A2X23_10920 [Chloroflexi bacterium GWC2_73_18]